MNPEILSVPEEMSVRELARFLIDHEITGAPVEDKDGKLVGVVSVVDIASVASDDGTVQGDRSSPSFFVTGWENKVAIEEIQSFRIENDTLRVGEIMTPEVYSIAEDERVSEVASAMLRGHLHRLLVTRDDRPIGIVSTSDLLGLLIDEPS
jgi:CBS domain-containing protein